MSTQQFIHVPYGKTVHGEEEIEAVVSVLRTSTQMGKHVREMEEKVATLFSKKHGIMVNSGSSANYLAIEILGLPAGSEVITPTLTFSTTVAPLIRNGLIPAFVDVEEGTFNIDANQVEAMITPKTRAMMIPNLLGNLPNWKMLRDLADKYNLIIIEDSADTLGATIGGSSVGRFSDISTTSFYGSHVVNCAGNGGMLCVNEDTLASRAKLLRSWGRSSSLFVESEAIENRFNIQVDGIDYDAKFVFEALGYNLEPSEMGAAFGLVQLSKLDQNINARDHAFQLHTEFFSRYKEWFILPKQLPNSHTGWLAFPLTIKDSAPFSRKELQIFLEKRNIQTRTVFTGNILRQPGFSNIERRESAAGYPNADRVMRGGILLGCHHGLTPEMMDHIHQSFEQFAKTHAEVTA
ncbi:MULTISPECIES: DegT/DnrJ/EryC1/StrS family aminotransferase [Legionella]|uniref:Cell wall biosynthesis regulatory pyridoxal phosphate-dependent protein n=1 Tax=Legionella drozanskii LLAP-1 TaxID=1212489 RepID=A0A0W0SMS9_9GAMM|nr:MULTISPECIES: aminotransferase class I/II-fold pyridoxal phosphate-dependent enzyme [Legionella]KTC84672.1 cell wall biosynthesis regulatory pyridoxal phosphate-dependent protein [Legionella drozanskii LLAP-1]